MPLPNNNMKPNNIIANYTSKPIKLVEAMIDPEIKATNPLIYPILINVLAILYLSLTLVSILVSIISFMR